jgi:hypothetical protein
MGELVGRVFAQQDGAGVVQPRHRRGVARRYVVLEQPRMRRGAHARRVEHVLEAERDAVQRTAPPAGGELGLGVTCLAPRKVGGHGQIAVELGIDRRDAREVGLHELDRRQVARCDPATGLGDRQMAERLAHWGAANPSTIVRQPRASQAGSSAPIARRLPTMPG